MDETLRMRWMNPCILRMLQDTFFAWRGQCKDAKEMLLLAYLFQENFLCYHAIE